MWLFRVPHDPDPPAGAPGSVRTFRAARNYYKLRLVGWGFGQIGALIGITFSLVFLEQLERGIEEVRKEPRQPRAAANQPAVRPRADAAAPSPTTAESPKKQTRTKSRYNDVMPLARRVAEKWPWWLIPLLTVIEWLGILLYLVQIPVTYALARLDYELRWYIVTDRSLRIRAGLASVRESTMSFANVQQVAVSQGPLQRLLGIADLRVQSAGGGGDHLDRGGGESLHTGVFHGVDNAHEIRDLILERLRAFREAGLGDPDDRPHPAAAGAAPPPPHRGGNALSAAQDVLREARALRQALR